MNILKKYFDFSEQQEKQFLQLFELYPEWNSKINLISRKDIENLEVRHFLHSLSIAKFIGFKPNAKILDLGCGGGFPGIMLAILFPESSFTMIDGRNKKILVVNDIIQKLNLKNAQGIHGRAEELKDEQFDFVVTRAVAKVDKLKEWTYRLFKEEQMHAIPNGIIALKGNIKEEITLLTKADYYESVHLTKYFSEAFFEEKHLLYIQY